MSQDHSVLGDRKLQEPYASGERWHDSGEVKYARTEALELRMLLAVAAFLLFIYTTESFVSSSEANVAGCLAIIGILTYGVVRELVMNAHNIWGALLWFRLACIGYYGVGAVLPHFGTDETVTHLRRLYSFSDEEAMKSTVINVMAIMCVLIGALILAPSPKTAPKRPTAPMETVTLGFLVIGGIAHYGFVVPFLFGFGDGVLHSTVPSIAKLYHAGIMLLIIQTRKRTAAMAVVAFALLAIELVVSMLMFSKAQVMMICIFSVLAIFQVRPSLSRLAIGIFGAAILFSQVEPIVAVGRGEVIRVGGARQTATLEQRLEILQDYFDGRFTASADPSAPQASLSRLSYVNAGTLVISMYDRGFPGDTLDHLFVVLIPRFMWADKPLLTLGGQDLYTEATGQEGTSISAGLFAEAYWNMGWLGLPILMVPMGLILQSLSRLMVGYARQERWIFLPAILLTIQIGTRVDGHFVTDMVGPPVLVFVAVWLLRLIESQFAR